MGGAQAGFIAHKEEIIVVNPTHATTKLIRGALKIKRQGGPRYALLLYWIYHGLQQSLPDSWFATYDRKGMERLAPLYRMLGYAWCMVEAPQPQN